MRLTTKGRFAVTAMIDLALRSGEGPVTLAGISERQKISLSYLEQLFGKLRRCSLVDSVRGPHPAVPAPGAHRHRRHSVPDWIRARWQCIRQCVRKSRRQPTRYPRSVPALLPISIGASSCVRCSCSR